jgi:GT2 family glycosyltransferase
MQLQQVEEVWVSESPDSRPAPDSDYSTRIEVRGKFLFQGAEKFWVKGVTYGTFRPNGDGDPFPDRDGVDADFRGMSKAGINTVRVYTPPPGWLLDLAQQHGLRVMVGLAWEQHITFLDDKALCQSIERRVREQIAACAGHPAILCYSIGNEIPAPIVRWHGRRKIEKFLKRLYLIAKEEDPQALVTYVNYPTTEYLQLPFLDFCSFNVYLESEDILRKYLARLQNLAGDQPLLMAEIGLDSQRNGQAAQAEQLDWQIRTAFTAGCAGTFIFAWTDEWHRGGNDIEDWDFGLCTRERQPKPALEAVRQAYENAPFPADFPWPRISIVVCSFNGAATIRDTLESLLALDYPDYQVIVIDDGSTDETAAIAREYKVTPISTENRGLSNARNTGWQAATGEIVAYIDDDAYPDPHWLQYLAYTYLTTDYAAVGGHAPAPPGDGPIADCVANAPGRPVHVLLTDTDAEHIPGCNMSFRRSVLEAVGGFDPRYRAAGDDVDICWRILDRGWKIGFQPGALNWHHCRNSIHTYWKQQQGYGKAEALLEEKWPDKYNTAGHFTWQGRLYGKGITEALPSGRWRIYHGRWGGALFQSIYSPADNTLNSLPLMPEWYFVCWLLAFLSLLGLAWPPLLLTLPLLVLAVGALLVQSVKAAMKAEFPTHWPSPWQRFKLRCISAWLHLLQPFARLIGRIRHGLTPWRMRIGTGGKLYGSCNLKIELWSEKWRSAADWLTELRNTMRKDDVRVLLGGDFDAFDLQVRGGLLGSARLLMTQEEHGEGKQMLRFAIRSKLSRWGLATIVLFSVIGVLATADEAWIVAAILIGFAVGLGIRSRFEATTSAAAFRAGIEKLRTKVENG